MNTENNMSEKPADRTAPDDYSEFTWQGKVLALLGLIERTFNERSIGSPHIDMGKFCDITRLARIVREGFGVAESTDGEAVASPPWSTTDLVRFAEVGEAEARTPQGVELPITKAQPDEFGRVPHLPRGGTQQYIIDLETELAAVKGELERANVTKAEYAKTILEALEALKLKKLPNTLPDGIREFQAELAAARETIERLKEQITEVGKPLQPNIGPEFWPKLTHIVTGILAMDGGVEIMRAWRKLEEDTQQAEDRLTTALAALRERDAEIEKLVAELADQMKWNWTQMVSCRDAANLVLALMVEHKIIEGCQHPNVQGGTGYSTYRVNGNLYGRTDGIPESPQATQTRWRQPMSDVSEAIKQAAREIIGDVCHDISPTNKRRLLAILRKHFGPTEASVKGNGVDRFWVSRKVLGGYEYLKPNGEWTTDCLSAYFPKRAGAEAALNKAKETP